MDYQVYRGHLSETPVDLARAALTDSFSDYIFFRSDEYQYTLIVGNIDFDTNYFSDSAVYRIIYNPSFESNSDRYYQYFLISDSDSGYVRNPENYQMYSSRYLYPHLVERGDVYVQTAILFSIVIFFSVFIFDRIFSNVSRR